MRKQKRKSKQKMRRRIEKIKELKIVQDHGIQGPSNNSQNFINKDITCKGT